MPKWPTFLPFYIPQLEKSLPFYIPEAWKRYPFRAEPPRIGHYREYSPPPGKLPPIIGQPIKPSKSLRRYPEKPAVLFRSRPATGKRSSVDLLTPFRLNQILEVTKSSWNGFLSGNTRKEKNIASLATKPRMRHSRTPLSYAPFCWPLRPVKELNQFLELSKSS